MSKRLIIWSAVVIVVVGVVVTLQRIKRTQMEQEGRVSYHKKSGDLIQFLTRELQQYGGTLTVTGSLPVMRTEWRYAEDINGFQILIAQNAKAELLRCLTGSLGEPMIRDKYPHLVCNCSGRFHALRQEGMAVESEPEVFEDGQAMFAEG